MAYDPQKELSRVKKFYEGDPMQKRFSALVLGSVGAGKSYLLRTARFPIHIDSFDPGGSKCLKPWIEKDLIVVDSSFEHEDPFNPSVWAKWTKVSEMRLQIGYFNLFGTYAIDSSTKWQDAAMNSIMAAAGKAGEVPRMRHDYNPTKILMVNYINKFMNLPCDFFMMGHLRDESELISVDSSTGAERYDYKFRFLTIGQAATTIPLMFDEIYILKGEGSNRILITDAQNRYIARSRLKGLGKLSSEEPANIKELLKKAGLTWEDKPKLVFNTDDVKITQTGGTDVS